jgi:hypothetical protein
MSEVEQFNKGEHTRGFGENQEEGGITGDEKKWMDNGFGGTMELKGGGEWSSSGVTFQAGRRPTLCFCIKWDLWVMQYVLVHRRGKHRHTIFHAQVCSVRISQKAHRDMLC